MAMHLHNATLLLFMHNLNLSLYTHTHALIYILPLHTHIHRYKSYDRISTTKITGYQIAIANILTTIISTSKILSRK